MNTLTHPGSWQSTAALPPSKSVRIRMTDADATAYTKTAAFREGYYLKLLNQILTSECNAYVTYSDLSQKQSRWRPLWERHGQARALLVNLIISNEGIPKDSCNVLGEMGSAIAQLSTGLPEWLQTHTTWPALYRLEFILAQKYERLVEQAPIKDRIQVRKLCDISTQNVNLVSQLKQTP